MFEIDPVHLQVGDFKTLSADNYPISYDVWKDKYRWGNEVSILDSIERVVQAIYAKDNSEDMMRAKAAMDLGLWVPAGRIWSGAGTPKHVTLMNCYVNGVIEDSLASIMEGNNVLAFTSQQGGGIGSDFSNLRPFGAKLGRTRGQASGPLPFMDMYNSTGATIRSAGDRRAAQMGTLSDTHPDLISFIDAKKIAGRLTGFNVSILVSDAFMEAVREDADWLLYFHIDTMEDRGTALQALDFIDDNDTQQYVYSCHKARDLWRKITETTYEYSEPGVIFIDRVNDINNLGYCETIRCTNPCGEQPLPPNGTCNLGSINLSRLVRRPFTDDATFDFRTLAQVAAIGTRFLDNVIDVTGYPNEAQRDEEIAKRRLGLGDTGLGDCLAMLQLRYGSAKSVEMVDRIARTICHASYETSIELAKEKGPFPLFDADGYLADNTFANQRLDQRAKEAIRAHGIRNSLLLTNAPTGTTTVAFCFDGSSGVEPVFEHSYKRNVRQADNSYKPYICHGYASKVFRRLNGEAAILPAYMVTVKDLSVNDHIAIQAASQRWVDASVSKTVNIPKDMPYADFIQVYELAYASGCKGCTTYRPSAVRGSILETLDAKAATIPVAQLKPRPDVLHGHTHKIKWPSRKAAIYLTVNVDPDDGKPFEVIMSSKDSTHLDWVTALTLMITSIFRKGGDTAFVSRELSQIEATHDGAWMSNGGDQKKYFPSLPAYIGYILGRYVDPHSPQEEAVGSSLQKIAELSNGQEATTHYLTCPSCSAPSLTVQEGCRKCLACGYSSC